MLRTNQLLATPLPGYLQTTFPIFILPVIALYLVPKIQTGSFVSGKSSKSPNLKVSYVRVAAKEWHQIKTISIKDNFSILLPGCQTFLPEHSNTCYNHKTWHWFASFLFYLELEWGIKAMDDGVRKDKAWMKGITLRWHRGRGTLYQQREHQEDYSGKKLSQPITKLYRKIIW